MKLLILTIATTLITSFSFTQENIKVMFYNMLKFPTTLLDRGDTLKLIIQHVQPDIFVIEELQTLQGANYIFGKALNVDGITKYKKGIYENANGYDTDNMIFYNSEKVELLEQHNINTNLRALSEYILYYKDPNLAQTHDTTKLYVYACHLKAAQGATEEQMRLSEAQSLKNYLTNHGRNRNIIVGGDFNLYSSSEDAYVELINGGTTHLNDPINQSGNWHNNYSFSAIHTQSTRASGQASPAGGSTGGLDDRFDLILVSNDIMNGSQGVHYVLNSYKAIGQDGAHFNDGVNQGYNSSVPPRIADALYYVSDHLPITLELEVGGPLSVQAKENMLESFKFNSVDCLLSITLNQLYSKVKVRIFNTAGQNVIEKQFSGIQTINEYFPELNSGMYIVQIVADGQPVSGKVLVY